MSAAFSKVTQFKKVEFGGNKEGGGGSGVALETFIFREWQKCET